MIGERALMPRRHRAIQRLGHGTDRGRTHRLFHQAGQGLARLARGDTQQEHLSQGGIDRRFAALVTRQHLTVKKA